MTGGRFRDCRELAGKEAIIELCFFPTDTDTDTGNFFPMLPWFHNMRPLYLAPMAGVTDSVFRRLCKEHGADVLVTEFVSADGILHGRSASNCSVRIRIAWRRRPNPSGTGYNRISST
jgi:hypothetical protein